MALRFSCTIPTFFIKRGAWLQHRASTLALWIMFVMTIPQFADRIARLYKVKPDISDEDVSTIIAQTLRLDMRVIDEPEWRESRDDQRNG